MYRLVPTEYEILDEENQLVAKVKMFDDQSATVTVHQLVNASSWRKLMHYIRDALDEMEIGDDYEL